jgi:two-component system, OmpR family, sensor histidine kinase MprB
MSLRARFILGTACGLALSVCAGFIAAYLVIRGQLRGEIDRALKERATALIDFTRQTPARPPIGPRALPSPAPKLGGAAGYIQLVGRTGQVTLPPGESVRLPTADVRAVAAGTRPPFFTDTNVDGTHVRIFTAHLANDTAVQIARPLTEADNTLARIRLLLLLVGSVTIAGAAAAGMAVTRAILRPVQRLTDDAEQIATTGNVDQRTDERRSDELGRLARAFNTMLDTLARSINAQRQLVADASHELRTPLASARANLELVELHDSLPLEERRRLLAEAGRELREMTNLIEELLELARADAHKPEVHPVRLDHLVEEAVDAVSRRSSSMFQTALQASLVEASPSAVTRAVTNLLDNAVKWSPVGAPIEVRVKDGTVTVRDHGTGIDPADLPHIFDRFYRAPNARTMPGSGLGLAIVRQVAETHGGNVTVDTATDGGTIFAIRLPTVGDVTQKPSSTNSDCRPRSKLAINAAVDRPRTVRER